MIRRASNRARSIMPGSRWCSCFAVQTAFAGVLGLPGAGAGLAVIDQVFPELEVNKNVRKWANMIFAGDEENGNAISDVAMMGIPSMFGWDLQSRMSMGNLVPGVSEFNGFQPENLAGPAVHLGAQLFKGVSQALTGRPGEAALTLDAAGSEEVPHVSGRRVHDQGL